MTARASAAGVCSTEPNSPYPALLTSTSSQPATSTAALSTSSASGTSNRARAGRDSYACTSSVPGGNRLPFALGSLLLVSGTSER